MLADSYMPLTHVLAFSPLRVHPARHKSRPKSALILILPHSFRAVKGGVGWCPHDGRPAVCAGPGARGPRVLVTGLAARAGE
jgi:hypothetical protein